MLGTSGIGKTSLVHRIVHNEFGYSSPTIGALFSLFCYKDVVAGIWDTAGSERYDSISSHYCHGAAVAVLAYSIVDLHSFQNLNKYYEKILDTTTECILFIVGTMLDLALEDPTRRVVAERAGQAFASSIGAEFFETSAKMDINVQTLFQTAVDQYRRKQSLKSPPRVPKNLLVHLREEEQEQEQETALETKVEKENSCFC
eukprot:TRINITY_DN1422_c0_g1_i2.p1 TRINITY_DN1422_c0_g1~~TRINITY_DN1422_c0_g1_i2.p1  ORF type:complete len:201 (+),score=51.95 TRINITY_DN1422_c0_g1_i2:428-1030(+)